MASSSSSEKKKYELLRETLLKQFQEYYEKRKDMATVFSVSAANGFASHGTTCASIINRSGLFFAGDGLSRRFNYRDLNDRRIEDEDVEKVLFVGNRMLISFAGSGYWYYFIIALLQPLIESPELVNEWDCRACAEFVYYTQHLASDYIIEYFGLKEGALEESTCSMMFGAYEQNQPKLFYGDEKQVQEIVEAGVYNKEQDPFGKQGICWKTMGAGEKDVADKLDDGFRKRGVNIFHGDLAHFEEQLILLLSSMEKACSDQENSTGGVILVYFMPPPPGVAHIVYQEHHVMIELDIAMLKADLYYRLYHGAGDSIMEDVYLNQFLQYSDAYVAKLEEYKADNETNMNELDEEMQEQDEKLVNLCRRRRRRRSFKRFKLHNRFPV